MQTSIATLAQVIPAIYIAFTIYLQYSLKSMFDTKPLVDQEVKIREREAALERADRGITALRARKIDPESIPGRHEEVKRLASARFYALEELMQLRKELCALRFGYIFMVYSMTVVSLLVSLAAVVEFYLLYLLFHQWTQVVPVLFAVAALMALLGIYSIGESVARFGDPNRRICQVNVHGEIAFGVCLVGGIGLLLAAAISVAVIA
ncbi:hypothetical protein ABZY32_17135 [Nocardiopsis alba]|uniref:hypothetical protein n=1 Tax=Nocardiopsis alba TaxID=53437 RepID=UPI0033ADEE30